MGFERHYQDLYSGRVLDNIYGRLSDCVCCCDGLADYTLYSHFISDPSCADPSAMVDESYLLTWMGGTNGHCDEWQIDNWPFVPALFCYDETGPGQLELGPWLSLYCDPPDDFALDLCLQTGSFGPPGTDGCSNVCFDLVPDAGTLDFCDAQVGDVWLDFGFVHNPSCGTNCGFYLIITDTVAPPAIGAGAYTNCTAPASSGLDDLFDDLMQDEGFAAWHRDVRRQGET